MSALSSITGIDVLETKKSYLVTAGDYRLLITRQNRPHAVKRPKIWWAFDEESSDRPNKPEHFTLRRLLNEALNGQ